MKKTFLGLVIAIVSVVACNNNDQSKEIATKSDTTVTANTEEKNLSQLTEYLQVICR